MFAELLGKEAGYCRGKGGSMHIADPETGNLGANAIVGGSAGIATGAALSAKMRGSGQVAVCFFGDGALGQGLLYEAMNMAALWKLPVIYVCENNLYGEYTPNAETAAGKILDRAARLRHPRRVGRRSGRPARQYTIAASSSAPGAARVRPSWSARPTGTTAIMSATSTAITAPGRKSRSGRRAATRSRRWPTG